MKINFMSPVLSTSPLCQVWSEKMVRHLRPVTYFQHLFNISQMFGSYAEKNGLEVVRYEKVKNFEELAMGGRNRSSQYQRHTPYLSRLNGETGVGKK